MHGPGSLISTLAIGERYRDEYWRKRDPILDDRLLWRAQAFRHTVHLLPGESILELGCGGLKFTRALLRVSRRENPITSVTFQADPPVARDVVPDVELIQLRDFPGELAGRRFDYVIAMDLLDRSTSSELLEIVHKLLTPGGEIVFYESNPWNPVYKLRRSLLKLFGKTDPRNLIDRPGLYELLSETGFIRIYAVFNDFVYAAPTRREVVEDLQLRQPGFAVNAETGLQPLLLGYKVGLVPISWINRTPGMGIFSFRLAHVGGGYWHVLLGLWLRAFFRAGPYRNLCRHHGAMEMAAHKGIAPHRARVEEQ